MTETIAETDQVIVGTAGHIDHGKTALVKALTGIDADTLTEEKRRGITIELGFVFLDEPGFDKQIVFIDVPGHEKLVRTMVAGASNIDAALLVIAADDGISAQTVEHFDILQLLGIEGGIIALTKADLVGQDRLDEVTNEIGQFVSGTFLQTAPIIPVSSLTGEGVDQVRSALVSIGQKVKRRRDSGIFRMPVDRVFTMHGFGTVIAGTVLSGRVAVGDVLEVFPDGIKTRVRGIQIHNQITQKSLVGKRTALNLHDVRKEALRRGQCVALPGSLSPSVRLDARLRVLKTAGKELKNRDRLRLHVQTDEVICRIALLDGEKLLPGETGLVQLVLESRTVALPRDRFIIRTFSPIRTVGGGVILDPSPRKHKRFDAHALEGISKLEGDWPDVIEQMVLNAGPSLHTVANLAVRIGAAEEDIVPVVEKLCDEGKLVKIAPGAGGAGPAAGRHLHTGFYESLRSKLLSFLEKYFARHPHMLLMPVADLQSQFLRLAEKQVFEAILDDLCRANQVYKKESRIGIVGRDVGLTPPQRELAGRIETMFEESGFATPLEEDVRTGLGADPATFEKVMRSLLETERLVRLSEKVTYHQSFFEKTRRLVIEQAREKQGITVGELRDLLGVSRKYALALLEHFDNIGLTRREGDKHVLK
jgi:selenocysteine-specific elongation factor